MTLSHIGLKMLKADALTFGCVSKTHSRSGLKISGIDLLKKPGERVDNSPMNIKDILWAFTHKLKDAFPIVSISFDEVKEDKKDESPYNEIPERY